MKRKKFRTYKRKGKRQRVRTVSAKFNMESIQGARLNNKTASRKQTDKDTGKCTQMNIILIAYSGIVLPVRGLVYYLMFSE